MSAFEMLLLGAGLGLAAGSSPGPLLTLVITATLDRGLAAGIRVAIAPLLTDAPIILISLLVLHRLPASFLSALTLLGGCFLFALGLRYLLRTGSQEGAEGGSESPVQDLTQGMVVNLLNPHPWIGWATVLGPLVINAWRSSRLAATSLVFAFYVTIVGSKMAVAWLVARAGGRLSERGRRVMLAVGGVLLLAFGLLLVWQGGSELLPRLSQFR